MPPNPETSATKIHKKVIDWPMVFFRKKELQKMLTLAGLIIRVEDGSVEHYVRYHGMLVKAWKLDWDAFRKRCKGDY